LYRDTVITNRLTQRQSVNVPLMKETIKTILANIDDAPDLYFENLDNDKQRELFMNEYWKWVAETLKLELLDMVDKKQVLLYGRSFLKLNIVNGQFYVEVLDPQDVLVDRYVDPANINTGHRITHIHIFRTLGEIAQNSMYTPEAVARLKTFYGTQQGLIKAGDNAQALADRNQRLEEMGVTDINNPVLSDTYVELQEMQYREWDETNKEFVVRVAVRADSEILMDKPLREILGINRYNYITWAGDLERTDFWSDGEGDIVRVPNQILNVWLSQLVENRTLRNFGMNYYNSSIEGFNPGTFIPSPWGWYPIPAGVGGDMTKVFQHVEIPELSESLDEMQYVTGMVQSATAATGTEKGVKEKGTDTLGEVQLLSAKAMKRMGGMTKFYHKAWREFGDLFVELVEANTDKLEPVKLYKKSVQGNYFEKEVKPTDWKSKSGYKTRVTSKAEKDEEQMEQLTKMMAVRQLFPMNPVFDKVMKETALDIANLDPDKKREILDADAQAQEMAASLPAGQPGQAGPPIPLALPQPTAAHA
jgi:hypothetical protein